MVQLVQQNHPKECSQIDSSNPDFAPIYWNMNNEELSMFNSLRQITQDISTYDSIMLMLLDKKSIYLEKIPVLRDLYDHLDSWLKQYKEIFHRPEVSLIYEYDKPFPPTIKELVERKIKELKLQIWTTNSNITVKWQCYILIFNQITGLNFSTWNQILW